MQAGLNGIEVKRPEAAPGGWGRLGGYRVLELLRRGGPWDLFLAQGAEWGEPVHLLVPRGPYPLPDALAAAFRDAVGPLGVSHPRLLAPLELGEYEGVPFAVYPEGGECSLDDLMAALRGPEPDELRNRLRDRLPGSGSYVARVAALLAGIGEGLVALHGSGRAHGNVQLANLLVLRDGGALAPLAAPESLIYHAPERLTAEGKVLPPDPAGDVYALGVVFYELLALAPPFEAYGQRELAERLRHGVPRRLVGLSPLVSPAAEAIALRALERAPSRRYPSAAALVQDLRALASGGHVAAAAPSRLRRSLEILRSYVPARRA